MSRFSLQNLAEFLFPGNDARRATSAAFYTGSRVKTPETIAGLISTEEKDYSLILRGNGTTQEPEGKLNKAEEN